MIANTSNYFWRAMLAAVFLIQAPVSEARSAGVEEAKFVPIGGIEQWITIKGQDRSNPVILFLHGGPGNALSPFADAFFGLDWQREFTLVQWDQRGAGRTYGKSGPAIEPTMTIDRMVDDGIEVAQYVKDHLGKQKIILVGGSWGSVLGIYMVRRRPDLFYAYLGNAQIVNVKEAQVASYTRVLDLARANDDQKVISDLVDIGPAPWDSFRKWAIFHKDLLIYQAKVATAPSPPITISPEYSAPAESALWSEAADFSFVHFAGLTLSGQWAQVDLPALGTDFSVPIYIVQGQEDITTLPELARAYLNTIRAPKKRFITVPGTGHEPSAVELEVMRTLLLKQVKPVARATTMSAR